MAGIPQVITEDRASGALVIDGSLKFDSSKGQYLKRTPTTNGNRKLWTWSGWLKQTPGGSEQDMFSAGQQVTNDGRYSRFRLSSDSLNLRQWVEPGPTLDASLVSSMKLRDPSAFFHCVICINHQVFHRFLVLQAFLLHQHLPAKALLPY